MTHIQTVGVGIGGRESEVDGYSDSRNRIGEGEFEVGAPFRQKERKLKEVSLKMSHIRTVGAGIGEVESEVDAPSDRKRGNWRK
ncbi:hypothetical protein [Cytobacillus pseudoceanisediminis]|uniref:hypothetical protein n=1 Tax=Cytobacillus pseudoceanisediminis TaxID=3051614 RepID=UPI003C2E1175